MAGVSLGPTPWWQIPQGGGRTGQATLANLQSSAPSGYEYDPVKMAYVRTPTSAGQRVNEFSNAAMGNTSTSLTGLMSAAAGGVGNVGAGGGVSAGGPVGGGGNIDSIAPIDTSAANSAIFARAKDTAGKIGRSSLDSLRGLLGETGQLGSGSEVQGTRDIVENAAGQVGDVNRELAIQNANQGLDVAKTNQAAKLTERGQNINAQEANARLALAQTQLQFQQAQQQSQRQLDLLKLALGQANNAMSAGSSFLY